MASKFTYATEDGPLPENKAELRARLEKELPLFFVKMNTVQDRFIRVKNDAGHTPKRRILEAGNKCGKCVTFDTLISTPNGEIPIGKLFENQKSFDVYAWDGEKKVIAHASPPFQKPGLHQCYRIEMSDGRWIEAADEHNVLTHRGYESVASLYRLFSSGPHPNMVCDSQSVNNLPVSISEPFQPVQTSSDPSLSGKQSGCWGHCLPDYRLYDERPQLVIDNVLVYFPLLDDVQQLDAVLFGLDDWGSKYTNIHPQEYGHLSKVENLPRRVVRYVASLFHNAYIHVRQWIGTDQVFPQQSFAGFSHPLPSGEYLQSWFAEYPLSGTETSSLIAPPVYVDGNYIIHVKPISVKQKCYDFSVKKYHNYFAGGLINHNTMIGLMEDLAHMMGFRPWLVPEDPDYLIDIKIPSIGLLGCETYKHSVAEKIEPMLRWLTPSTCQPVFKPGPTGVLNILTLPYNCKGGKCGSKLHIRSYDEQASSFEGQDYDFQHWDEPPPESTLTAAERGKVVTNAPSWFTMTPLKEPYIHDKFSMRAGVHG